MPTFLTSSSRYGGSEGPRGGRATRCLVQMSMGGASGMEGLVIRTLRSRSASVSHCSVMTRGCPSRGTPSRAVERLHLEGDGTGGPTCPWASTARMIIVCSPDRAAAAARARTGSRIERALDVGVALSRRRDPVADVARKADQDRCRSEGAAVEWAIRHPREDGVGADDLADDRRAVRRRIGAERARQYCTPVPLRRSIALAPGSELASEQAPAPPASSPSRAAQPIE